MSATSEEKAGITQTFSQDSEHEENLSAFQRIPKRYILAVMAFLGFGKSFLSISLSEAHASTDHLLCRNSAVSA